ncbi:hypothetical protein PUN28_003509 [Cardiocondyla obscurior]|uniref:Secreted protein n=1 Tax=Cardiocondyla obscurior TaxID=286306 RepID=A0AAW2GMG6_9HYME
MFRMRNYFWRSIGIVCILREVKVAIPRTAQREVGQHGSSEARCPNIVAYAANKDSGHCELRPRSMCRMRNNECSRMSITCPA